MGMRDASLVLLEIVVSCIDGNGFRLKPEKIDIFQLNEICFVMLSQRLSGWNISFVTICTNVPYG